MISPKIFKILAPLSLMALLSGCGATHQASHTADKSQTYKPTYTVHNHEPKGQKTEDGGTKSVNTASDSSSFPKNHLRLGSSHGSHSVHAVKHDKKPVKTRRIEKKAKHGLAKARADDSHTPYIDLGNGAKAEEDRGAGQTYITYHLGKWQVIVHGNDVDESSNSARDYARMIDSWAQKHSMPAPKSHGTLTVDVSGPSDNTATASWNTTSGHHNLTGSLNSILSQLE